MLSKAKPSGKTRERERCREYLPQGGCQNYVPQGKSPLSFACQMLHLCRDCYRVRFPKRRRIDPTIVIEGNKNPYGTSEGYDDSPYGWLDQFHGDMR